MWKCVFGEMDMCICLCQNTGAMNRSPTPGGVFRGYFVGVRCIINNPFASNWQAVSSCRGRFIVPVYTCSPRVCYLCVTYSPCKSMVFALQKYGFWRAKTPFLHCKNPLFEMQYTKQRTRNNEVWYYI